MLKLLIILSILFLPQVSLNAATIDLRNWKEISDRHFKIVYKNEIESEECRKILNQAENYYSKIADHIGYGRYHNFWTWDERVLIVYYSSQEDFIRSTGRPAWSKGFSYSHFSSVNLRMIVTFNGQEDFLNTTLPHEISHLILHDFINNHPIPLWFDEGVAQLEEQRDDVQNQMQILARLIHTGQAMSLGELQSYNPKVSTDETHVAIFYAESLYIVDFLVKTYGIDAFVNLCRNMSDGKSFEEALSRSYYPTIDSMNSLQKEWVKYITRYL